MKVTNTIVILIIAVLFCSCNSENTDEKSSEIATQSFIQNEMRPIVFVTHEGLFLLGGFSNNQWIKVQNIKFDELSEARNTFKQVMNVDINLLKGDETFNFYSKQEFVSQISVNSRPYYYSSPASGEDFYAVPTDVNIPYENLTIGINGDWEAMPREVQLIDNSFIFDTDGNNDKAKISLANGNNDDEKVEVLMEYKSQVFKIIELQTSNIPQIYECISILDLNGDGRFEIIILDTSTSGGIFVWDINDIETTRVLSLDLGD